MRVYQLNTCGGVKSTGRIALDIARLVEAQGGKCRIAYGVPGVPDGFDHLFYRMGTPLERKVHGALRKLLDAEGYGSRRATRRMIKDLSAFSPDVVHLHNLHGCYVNLQMLFDFLSELQRPVVWTLHDCWPFTGHCAYFDYAACDRWKTGCRHCPQQRSYPPCFGLDGSARNYAHKRKLFTSLSNLTLVTPCEWMRQPLSSSFLSGYPVRVIPNGVDLTAFCPTQSDLRKRYDVGQRKLALGVASEWDERKGLRYIAQASERMGEGYLFAAIGVEPGQLEGLPGRVLGLRRTQSVHELAQWYTAADCLVNPTLEDNMPMVNLEALACGTPVAVFATGGCPEAVDETCGKVVAKGDVEALCGAVAALCERKPVDACLLRAKRFDSRRTYESYVRLYEELCT